MQVQLSVALHHVLPVPANRTIKAYIHLACWELTANVMFPATLAAQLYQNTNLVSQQLSKMSLPPVSSVMARETNVGHISVSAVPELTCIAQLLP